MSNALATLGNVPAYLQQYVQDQPDLAQFGHLDRADFSLNFIKCVSSSSPQLRAGWGPTRQEPALPLGTLFLSRDGTVLPSNTPFIPLCRGVRFIYYDGPPGKGKLVFMTDNPNDEKIKAINGLEFTEDPQTKKRNAPLVTTYINFYVMIKGCDAPVILPFKRTSTKDGRRFTQDIIMATKGGMLPMFSLLFKLTGYKEETNGTQYWNVPTFAPAGFTPAEMIEKAAKMKELAENIAKIASAEDFIDEHDDATPATNAAPQTTPPLKQAQPVPAKQPTIQTTQMQPAQQPTTITVPGAEVQDQSPQDLAPVW